MAPRITVKVDQPAWLKMIREKQRPVATAAIDALREVADQSVQAGRSDIASAGRRQFLRLPSFAGTNIGWFCIDFRVNHRFRRTRVTGKP